MTTNAAVAENDLAYVFHSWSAQAELSPIPIAGGEGAEFWDFESKRYLDFSSQLVNLNLGHQHPRLVEAISKQAQTLCTVAPPFANDARAELARRIVAGAGEPMAKVFFTNGGADANEHAVRMARLHTGRRKVMSMYRSYHGATQTAITLTGDPRRLPNEPGDPSIIHFFGPYPYRSTFGSQTPEEETEKALTHIKNILEMEGPTTVAAIVCETVVGTNGILIPPPGYLPGLRQLCDEHGILLILDEVMAGFGRCGELFAYHAFDVQPDLVTFAKGVNSGYVPLGGVIISEAVASTFDHRAFPGGLTYSGHPLACAVGIATFDIFDDDDILGHVKRLSDEVVAPRLNALKEANEIVGDVRGLGLFWAIELVSDRDARTPVAPAAMASFAAGCKEAGLYPFVHNNRTHVVPPLVITDDQLHRGIDIIEAQLAKLDPKGGPS